MIRNILTIAILCLFTFLAFHFESATSVKSADTEGFSVENAFTYLEEIGKEPHPIGSKENRKVRDYIKEQFESEGLEVELQSGYTRTSWKPSYLKMARVENVIATLKGSDPDAKKVVISCHYDSVIEGPGAADDGYAVACAIETAKLLKSENRKNDIVFLITDGEEYGLLGAQYYAENKDLSNIGVMLNYEARGNEGPGIAFELSDNNGWLIDQISKAYRRPIANSLSFEVYKRMGNGSDFTIFKEQDVAGINHAFIDGFSYYHHPQDNIQNISEESVQHTGENMYLAAKHFANYDFKEEAKRNSSYFNFYGLFINYGADLDMFLFILALLLLTLLIISLKQKTTTKGVLISFFGILGSLVLCSAVCFGLSYLLKSIYPQYSTFYAYHYYNHEWYLLSGVGITIIISYFSGRILLKKYNAHNLGIALSFLIGLLSLALYMTAQSATYVMMFPVAIISLGLLLQDKLGTEQKPWIKNTIGLVTLILLIGFWAVLSHALYLAFSLNILAAAVIPTVLFCFASYALIPDLWKSTKLMLIFGGLLVVVTLAIAHLQSKPTEDRPLKSNLFYTYDSEDEQTYIATYDDYINEGHLGMIDEQRSIELARHMPYANFANQSDQSLSQYRSEISPIKIDTIHNSKSVRLKRPLTATRINLIIPEISNIDSLIIDNQVNKAFKDGATGRYFSPLYGIGLDSLSVKVVLREQRIKSKVYVNTQYSQMPKTETLPTHVVRNGGKVVISELLEF